MIRPFHILSLLAATLIAIATPGVGRAQLTVLPATRPAANDVAASPRWPPGVRFVFDAFHKTDRPEGWRAVAPGCVPMIVDEGALAPEMFAGGWGGPRTRLDPDRCRQAARNAAALGVDVVVLYFENWPRDIRVSDDADVQRSIDWWKRGLQWWREGNPNVIIAGGPGILRDFWLPIRFDAGLEPLASLQAWQRADDRFGYGLNSRGVRNDAYGLHDAGDFVYAECYLFYNAAADRGVSEDVDIASDRIYLTANISEAKRVAAANGNKPVVVSLMPFLHESSTTHTRMSERRWLAALDVLAAHGVHLAIWGNGPFDDYVRRMFELAATRFARPAATTQPRGDRHG